MIEFRFKFHWNMFPGVQLTISQHWFRKWLVAYQATIHYLDQWWPSSLMHTCSTRGRWIKMLFVTLHVLALYADSTSINVNDFRNHTWKWCHINIKVSKINANLLFNIVVSPTTKNYQSSALLALCEGNKAVTIRFLSQKASNAESVSMSWRHHKIYGVMCVAN